MAWSRGIVAIMVGGSSLPDMRHRADLTMIVGLGGVTMAAMSTHDRHGAHMIGTTRGDHTPH